MTFEYFVKWIKELYKLHIYISSKLSKRTNTENVLLGICLFFVLLYFFNLGGKLINEDVIYCCKIITSSLFICRAAINAFELRRVGAPLSLDFSLLGFRFSTLVNFYTFFIIIRALFFILSLVGIIVLHQLIEASSLRHNELLLKGAELLSINNQLSSEISSLSTEIDELSREISSLSVETNQLSSEISSLSIEIDELSRESAGLLDKNKDLRDALSLEESKLESKKS